MADSNTHGQPSAERRGSRPSDVVRYVQLALRWRRFLMWTAVVTGVCAAAYLWFFVPNEYQSVAAIKSSVVTTLNASGLGSVLNAKGIGDIGGLLGVGSQRSDLDMFMGVLQSDAVTREIVRRYDFQQEFKSKYIEDALDEVRSRLRFSVSREEQILTIAVRDTSPARARRICTTLVELLDSVNKALSRSNAQHAREYLELRYDKCLHDLQTAEDSLRQFQVRFKVYDMKDQATASIKVAAELEAQIVVKEAQANILAQTLGASDADTRRMFAVVDELKKQRQSLDTGLDINSAFRSIVPFASAPQLGMEYFKRYRDVEIQQRIFALLLPMVEQARVDEQRNTPTVLVLDSASLPERKVGPKRTIITLGIVAAALVFALVIAGGVERFGGGRKMAGAQDSERRA